MRYYEVLSGGHSDGEWDIDHSELISEEQYLTEARDRAARNLATYEEIQRKEESGETQLSNESKSQLRLKSIQGYRNFIAQTEREIARVRLEEAELNKAPSAENLGDQPSLPPTDHE